MDTTIKQFPKPSLERFLSGKPLTPELEDLQNGNTIASGTPDESSGPRRVAPSHKQQGLTNDDRENIRRMTLEPGWPTVLRMMEEKIDAEEQRVRAVSLTDPLANEKAIAQGWAYVALMRKTRQWMIDQVAEELRILSESKQDEDDRAHG